jgi:hypothetical protein
VIVSRFNQRLAVAQRPRRNRQISDLNIALSNAM